MLSQRQRSVVWAVVALVAIWVVAGVGYVVAKNSRMTAKKVARYVNSTDISKLSGEERAKAIRKLEEMINKLSPEERQNSRESHNGDAWFQAMTEEEKTQFVEAVMPSGFKQMINAFEQLPEEKRKRSIDEALKRLKETKDKVKAGQIVLGGDGTNQPPPISDELQAKIRTIGLKSFYSQSSAQTKAELAPVLEELQRVMEGTGRRPR